MNDQFTELVSYIKRHVQQGVPLEHIRTNLLQHNWQAELVDHAIWTALAPQSAPSQPSAVSELIGAPQLASQQPGQSMQGIAQSNQETQPSHAQQPTPIINDRPPKYTIRQAIKDFFIAARGNLKTFLLVTVISCILAQLSSTILLVLAWALPWHVGSVSTIAMIVGVGVGLTLWYAIMTAFIMASTSLPLYDVDDHKHTSLKSVLLTAFRRAKRIIIANLFMLVVATWPIFVVIGVPLLYFFNMTSDGGMVMLVLIPILSILAIIWMITAFVLFALVPYVAIFEPSMPIKQLLRRSQHLLSLGGYWFVVKGVLLSLGIYLLIAIASGGSLSDSAANSSNFAGNIITAILTVIINGVMVMLYRNRMSARR